MAQIDRDRAFPAGQEARGQSAARPFQRGEAIGRAFDESILAGDRVTLEMSPYDLTKGRINFRHKDERAPAPHRPQTRR